MTPGPFIRFAAGFVLILAAMWLSSLWLYDSHKARQAAEWRSAVLAGGTPFQWRFDSPNDIRSGRGIGKLRWEEGAVSGNVGDPHVNLNLHGRMIDARRYTRLVIELAATRDGFLRVSHLQGDDAAIHFSPPIPVRQGLQTVELDLGALKWSVHNDHVPDEPPSPSAWGSARGLVSALRIDPAQTGGFELRLVELRDETGIGATSPDITAFSSLADPRLEPLRHDPGALAFLAHDSDLRTPATAQAVRRAIAERYPSAILFPRPEPPVGSQTGLLWKLAQTGWIPSLVFAIALLVFAASPPASLPALLAYLALLGSFLFFEPHLAGAWKLPPLALLVWATWQLWPPVTARAWPGDPLAWLWLSPLIVGSVLLVFFHYERGPEDGPLWENLLVYLGWALVQQTLVARVVFERLRARLPTLSVLLGATALGFMHLPNFALMLGAFVLGLYLLMVYRRHPNLPALVMTHALAAVAVNATAPQWLLLSREIGPRFLNAL